MAADDQPSFAGIPHRVRNPERIPAARYYDEAFYQLERDHLWPHVWQMACRLEEIPEVGDFAEYEIFDKSVIIVRTRSGVKAFHNACRHRGVQIAKDHGNCRTKGFICPFHGWRWNIDGENSFVFGKQLFSEENLQKADIDLVPCRVELWGGCAFINFDDGAPSLLESLGPIAERLGVRNADKLKMEWWYQTVLPTNWKLAMEAFMEGYHVMRTHPQLHEVPSPGMIMYGSDAGEKGRPQLTTTKQFVDRAILFMERLSDGMAGMIHADEVAIARELRDMELPDDIPTAAAIFYGRLREEITKRGCARGMDMPDLTELAKRTDFSGVEYLFPNYFLLPTFSAMSSYRIRPLGPETCLFELWSLAFIPDDEAREPVRPVTLAYDSPEFPEIPRQDYSNLPLQQKGLHAKGFEYMRLSKEVEGMISNYQRLIDGYLAKLDPATLARASQIVNSGYDAPVLDIGF